MSHFDSRHLDERIKVEDDSIESSTTQKTRAARTLSETWKHLEFMKSEFEERHTSTTKATLKK